MNSAQHYFFFFSFSALRTSEQELSLSHRCPSHLSVLRVQKNYKREPGLPSFKPTNQHQSSLCSGKEAGSPMVLTWFFFRLLFFLLLIIPVILARKRWHQLVQEQIRIWASHLTPPFHLLRSRLLEKQKQISLL